MVRMAALSGARGALAPRRLSPRSHRSPVDGAGHLRNPDCLLWATRRQGPLLLNPRGRVTWPRPGLVRAGEAAGGDVAASNGAPQGVELRKAADAIVESLDEVLAVSRPQTYAGQWCATLYLSDGGSQRSGQNLPWAARPISRIRRGWVSGTSGRVPCSLWG